MAPILFAVIRVLCKRVGCILSSPSFPKTSLKINSFSDAPAAKTTQVRGECVCCLHSGCECRCHLNVGANFELLISCILTGSGCKILFEDDLKYLDASETNFRVSVAPHPVARVADGIIQNWDDYLEQRRQVLETRKYDSMKKRQEERLEF